MLTKHYDFPEEDVPVPPELPQGRESLKQIVTEFRPVFPDLHYTIELQIAEGDLVVTRATRYGTHAGEYRDTTFRGIPSIGKQVTWTYTGIVRIDYSSRMQYRARYFIVSEMVLLRGRYREVISGAKIRHVFYGYARIRNLFDCLDLRGEGLREYS